MKQVTIEITDYCPNNCPYCSSDAGINGVKTLTIQQVSLFLCDNEYDRINISGGEPLSHPQFYQILQLCKSKVNRTGFVAVYSNEIDCIMYNANVKYGVRVEANIPTLPNTNTIHVLKVVQQGLEKQRPDIHYSCNWDNKCGDCNNSVLKSDGHISKTPCTKFKNLI